MSAAPGAQKDPTIKDLFDALRDSAEAAPTVGRIATILELNAEELLGEEEVDKDVCLTVAREIYAAVRGGSNFAEIRDEILGLTAELDEVGSELEKKVAKRAIGGVLPAKVKAISLRIRVLARKVSSAPTPSIPGYLTGAAPGAEAVK